MLTHWGGQWSVTTEPDLFNLSGNHVHAGDEIQEDADVDIDKVNASTLWLLCCG